MKKIVRLNESELHNLIRESVNEVLNELSFETAYDAYKKSLEKHPNDYSPAMKRRLEKDKYAAAKQHVNIRNGVSNAFNRDYGVNLNNVPYGSGNDKDMDIKDKDRMAFSGKLLYTPGGDSFDTNTVYPSGGAKHTSKEVFNFAKNGTLTTSDYDDDKEPTTKEMLHPDNLKTINGRKAVKKLKPVNNV